jgi:superfamily II DNA or RNA helicase
MRPYGNELHTERAAAARSAVSSIEGCTAANVINDDFINIQANRGSFSLLYLNPPYDFDAEHGREEYRFLKKLRPLLAPGGLLVWIIPERIIADSNVQRYMASWFRDMVAYRFVGDSYQIYKQIVVYGTHNAVSVKPDPTVMRAIRQLSELSENLPQHPTFDEPLYTLQKVSPASKFWFYGLAPSSEAVAAEIKDYGIQQSSAFKSLLSHESLVTLDPLVPMKVGHVASTIAAGHINNQTIETEDGGIVLIKGSVYNEPVTRVTQEVAGTKTKTKSITVFDPRSVITTVNENGEIQVLQNEKLGSFLSSNLATVTGKLRELYPPRYNFTLGKWAKYIRGVNPRRIPNTDRKGLLPAQKHSAVAICTQWETKREAILVGQLGTGKTIISIAAAYAMYNKNKTMDHFIVMCPPHLVLKWIREVGLTWPEAKATELDSITEVDRFFAEKGPIFGILKSTKASQGSGWEHNIWYNAPTRIARRTVKEPVNIISGSKKVRKLRKMRDGDAGFLKAQAQLLKIRVKCPTCSNIIIREGRKDKDANMLASLEDFTNKKTYCKNCNGALWQDTSNGTKPRFPLAAYINSHYKGKIDIAIVDEAHQYKGEGSDRGKSYAHIVMSSRKVLAMTGTIYGGKASTLFFLLFRLSQDFRKAWVDISNANHTRMMWREWSKTYGVMEETLSMTEDSSSKNSGNRRPNRNVREIAGSSPAMLPWLLNRSVFVSLADMGMALPNYQEIAVSVEMDNQMKQQYGILFERLSDELGKRLIKGDRSLLAKYLYALLYWPDSPWRPKIVKEEGKAAPLVAIPGTGQPLGVAPKEAKILELIQEELAADRKCLLMVAQSNTLDIQPQWKEFLAFNNISSEILREDPYKREAWIKKQEKRGTQVLISNPKKVETGLDILGYPTIIWMSPDFSIYTVMQASGRAFRLGQTKDCKVYHFAYAETLQDQALRLVIAKAAAAKRVNGDTIDSDDLADLDGLAADSIENALAKTIMENSSSRTLLNEIALEFEQAQKDIYEGRFAECVTLEEAEEIYKELTTENNPQAVKTLADFMAIANEEFKTEENYLDGSSIQNDEDPEFVIESEPEPEIFTPVASETVKIVDEEQQPEPAPIVTVEPVQTRLVFGKATIKVTGSRKRSKQEATKVVQLSLF